MLAKALETYPGLEKLREAKDLNDIRSHLLDLIDATKETRPDARARMIRLQAKPAAEAVSFRDLSNLIVEPVTLISSPDMKPIALTHNPRLAEWLDSATGLIEKLAADGVYQNGEWRILRREKVSYEGGLTAYDCLAIRPKKVA